MHFKHDTGGCERGAQGQALGRAGMVVALLLAALCALGGATWAEPMVSAAGRAAANLGAPYEIYQVQPGDTVQNIAARFGASPELIANFNAISSTWELTPGQDLAIPLPGLAARESAVPGRAETTARILPPRYAVVTSPGQITSEPGAGKFLFHPAAGTRLVVKVDRGSHWGVVMVNGTIGWIDKSCLEVSDQTIAPEQLEAMLRGGRTDVVREATRFMGIPYRYGGSLPSDVDCSLLVQTAYAACGVSLPRTAAAQYEVGRPINCNELQAGDRLYFVSPSGRINHTGIYMGNGQFIHASARRGCVATDSLSDQFYWSRFVGARRS